MSIADLIAFGLYTSVILLLGLFIGYYLHKVTVKEEPKPKKTKMSSHDLGNLLEPVSPRDQRFEKFLEDEATMDRMGANEN